MPRGQPCSCVPASRPGSGGSLASGVGLASERPPEAALLLGQSLPSDTHYK